MRLTIIQTLRDITTIFKINIGIVKTDFKKNIINLNIHQ